MEKNEKSNKLNIKVILLTILIVILLTVFVVCAVIMIRNYKIQRDAEKQFEQMQSTVVAVVETEKEAEVVTETEEPSFLEENGIELPALNLDWKSLWEQNTDIYSWIYVPNTNVSYPVLQHATEHDYYLEYNIDHTKGRPGCIYTQRYNSTSYLDTNTILYGHNMKNGTMFKTLHNYEDEEFFDENRYFFIYRPDSILVYEVYAAVEFTNEHLLFKYDFSTEEGLFEFVEKIESLESKSSNNHVRDDVEITADSKLVTLSTCIYGRSTERWLVIGNLVGEVENEEKLVDILYSTEVTE